MDARMIGHLALGAYVLLLAAGGVIGFVKAGSRPSLIAGLGSAAVALLALVLTIPASHHHDGLLPADGGTRNGYVLGLILSAALLAMFGVRYRKTGKFMPSGMLLGVSLVMVGLMGWAVSTYR